MPLQFSFSIANRDGRLGYEVVKERDVLQKLMANILGLEAEERIIALLKRHMQLTFDGERMDRECVCESNNRQLDNCEALIEKWEGVIYNGESGHGFE